MSVRGMLADAGLVVRTAVAAARAGLFWPVRPVAVVRALREMGPSLASLVAVSAAAAPDQTAVLDEAGALTYRELHRRSRAIASGLAGYGAGPGVTVGLLCRNHRGFVTAATAISRLGADLVLLNTEGSARQLAQTLDAHRADVIILDAEFLPLLDPLGRKVIVAWHDEPPGHPTLDDLAATAVSPLPRPPQPGKITILTSGTTGVPRGVPRALSGLTFAGPATSILTRTGLRTGDPILIAPPLFHGFGMIMLSLALLLRSPVVLRRRFDAAAALKAIPAHRVVAVAAVPVMLQRILAVDHPHLSTLRVILSGAAPLPPVLARAVLAEFGDVLYNGYGSSEAGIAAVATPADLRVSSGTVGRPVLGVPIRVLDDTGQSVPAGAIGTVYVGGRLVFGGYTGGGSKPAVDGLLSTGDRGHFDDAGCLYIDGRADDMIVSGGENVYPLEVENLLAAHPGVAEAAVIGVPDPEYGQRLAAFVVPRTAEPGADELRAYVRKNLARYQTPRDVVFLAELPRNAAGKILRSALAEQINKP